MTSPRVARSKNAAGLSLAVSEAELRREYAKTTLPGFGIPFEMAIERRHIRAVLEDFAAASAKRNRKPTSPE